ncbi:non-ribosomal peptide synthetase [Brevibacillus laterosporus]|uniref:non-ribosomal peptide synthetase n=1 Tax=Brevibacillus laterosporus TaxID=1465 RepID=UPI000CE2C2F6|nr:non-ribosomal peptide synthetase [Brevibacillus laterosporus]PPA82420.1 non-ribosomal peptide synthetase [Brevibacillus laterosporus]
MFSRSNVQNLYRLSPMQKGILFHSLKDKENHAYFDQLIFTLEGKVELEYLEEAFNQLIKKHDILRTVFRYKKVKEPVQMVLKERNSTIYFEDISHLEADEKDNYINQFKRRDREKGFDLSRDLLIRLSLFKLDKEQYQLIMSNHHIIMDGWCLGIILNDFLRMYKGIVNHTPVPFEHVTPYSKHIQWLEKQDHQEAKDFYQQLLEGYDKVTGVPQQLVRANHEEYAHGQSIVKLHQETADRLIAIAKAYQVTVNTVFQTIWGILLQKYNNTDDVVFGSVVSGRPAEIPDVEKIVGLFINTIPVRIKADQQERFETLVTKVQEMALASESYDYLSLADIHPEAGDFINHIIAFENFYIDMDSFNQLADKKELGFSLAFATDHHEQTNYDLSVQAQIGDESSIKILYNSKLYSSEYIANVIDHFVTVAETVAANPSILVKEIDILTTDTKDQILHGFNNTYADYPREKTIHQLFEEQVEKNPNQVALVFKEEKLTYGEVNAKANQLAHVLRKKGVQPDDVIGLITERSLEMIIGILAIYKAGGAYMPIDPTYPTERVQYMLQDNQTQFLLVQKQEMLPASYQGEVLFLTQESCMDEEVSNLPPTNQAQALAYMMYTSGSTGEPKGILTTHQNIIKTVINNGYIEITPADCLLQLSNYAFDGSTFEIYGALLHGATLVLAPKETVLNMNELARLIKKEQVTVSFMTTALFNTLVDLDITCFQSVRKVLFGGELASVKHVLKALDYLGEHRIINVYGPTESTVYATYYSVDHSMLTKAAVPIGRPINNTKAYILNKDGQPQSIGVVGELCIGGEGLARGYLNRPELTQKHFVDNAFVSGERMYRTGDLARFLPDGNIEYIGRVDEQVKIRGHRIELGEIEKVLLQHPAISETVLLAKRDEQGHSYLCAYVVGQAFWTVTELRQHVMESLPEYMVPSYFIEIEKLPLTANGKVDKRALPEPDRKMGSAYVAPENETEEKLVQFFQEILGVERVGTQDTFFELGGHSLKAMMLVLQIHKEMGIEVPLKEIFTRPTIKELAAYIHKTDRSAYSMIEPTAKQEYYPVSFAQRRMFVVQQIRDTNTTSYNMPILLEIEGALDRENVRQTLKKLIERHESMRTSFHMIDETLLQKVHDDVAWEMEEMEASEEEVYALTKSFIRPFDLGQAPLFRAGLIRVNSERHLLLLDMHHIISDGVSTSVLFQDFTQLYRGRELPALRIQYKDFAVWQQGEAQLARLQEQEQYWLKQFSGSVPVLELPTDFPRPAMQQFDGDVLDFELDQQVWQELHQLIVKEGCTAYMLLLAAYHVLLAKYSSQNDIVIGSPIAGRTNADLQSIIGMFVNTLAIRTQSEGTQTFREFLSTIKQLVLQAQSNADYPFEELVDKVNPSRDLSRQPLFDTIFVMQNMDITEVAIQGLSIITKDMEWKHSKFDLTWAAVEKESLHFSVEYSTRLFKQETIERMAKHFAHLLNQVAKNPDLSLTDMELATDEEVYQLLEEFNNTEADYPSDKTIHQQFEQKVEENPDQIALLFKDREITYRQLNAKANQFARVLRKRGVQPDQAVGLITDRSIEMMIGILAILKAGGAYLPIDPTYPLERITYMLEDSQAQLLIVQEAAMIPEGYQGEVLLLAEECWMQEEASNLELINDAQDLAYVMYTSGSTGEPKGILTTHQNIIKTVINNGYIEITPRDCLLQLSNYAFDGSTFEIYGALLHGTTLVLAPKETVLNMNELARLIKKEQVTVSFMTTALFNTLVDLDITCFQSVRKVLFGGELASVKHVLKALDYLGEHRIINVYGPTESTVYATFYSVDHSMLTKAAVPIGRPINNTKAYILNKDGQPQPIGVVGELCIGGEGLARGYLNRPELTAERFVDNPFLVGERMYRTGDMARFLPDGNIEYIGRMDEQVKIRGHRIELGEIEKSLLEYPPISEAVLVAKRDEQGHSYLCAYVVSKDQWTVGQVRQHLLEALPEYMVPSYFVELEKLPLTSNGKVDKRALPEPDRVITNEYVAAVNETEEKLVQFFQEILAVERVGTQDTFFELGGHSLKAMMLVSRIHKELKIEVPLKEVFARQTVKELAAYIRQAEQSDYSEIQPAMEQEYYPVSNAQRRMYVVQQMRDVETTGYNMPFYFEMEGALEVEKLSLALKKLIERHESLRTSFHMVDDELMQKVHAEVAWEMEMIHAVEEEVQQLTDSFMRPFDLAKAPLFRAGLIQINPKRHLLMLDMHHIISDGVSMNVLFQDITQLYQGIELSPLKIQYKDFAVWQQGMAQVVRFQEQERYWLNQFSGDLPILEMVTDYPRPAIQQFDGDSWSFEIDAKVLESIKQLSAEQGTTLYMTLLAIYQILLSKYTRQDDIIVGTPIAGRPHADTESIVGMFVNTLALRSQPKEEQSFLSYLSEVKENVLQAYANADYPFEELVEKLHLQRDMSRHPLFDTMFVLQNMDMSDINISGLKLHSRDLNWKNAKFDMTWMIAEQTNLYISVEYSTNLFKRETIQRLEKHFTYLVEQVAKHPDFLLKDFELTTDEEKQQILTVFNDTATNDLHDSSICHLFEQQVQLFPDNLALVFGEKHLTYSELHAKVNQLARVLRKHGVQPDQAIGLITDRSIEMMIGILAILKAGGAYMPIDPSYPLERIEHMLEDSRTKLLLVQKTEMVPTSYQGEVLLLAEESWMHEEASNLEVINQAQDLAYVMYTSGSTGKPKGNLTTHQNIMQTIINNGYIEIAPTDRLLQLSNYAFDGSTFDIYSALLNGATLVLVPKEVMLNPMELAKIIREQDITVSFMTTSLFHTLVELDVTSMKSMRKVVFGGEKASFKHVEKALDYLGEGRLINGYGPTETTVFATTYTVDSSIKDTGIIPIGRPLNNTSVYVLNENNQLQPIGVPGELCVGGTGIARGYLNRPELTAERFVDNPFVSGDRMYRTGDLVRWLPNGNIEYLGRMDEQVKVRGYRIELGEIETRLLEHASISAAVLLAKQDEQGHSYLCAYVVTNGVWTAAELRKHVSEALPEYMVPTYFVELEQLPFTSNGKVNKRALPEPEGQITSVYVAPETETEAKLVELFQEILGVEKVGTQDMFFELGGHSLKAMMLVLRMNKELGMEVPLKEVFTHPTVKELAATIDLLDRSGHMEIEPAPKQDFYPVSSAQRRMYVVQHLGNIQTTSYNMPLFLEVEGALEIEKLHQALEQLVKRHESLRTSFHMIDEELMQQVHEDVVWDLEIMDGEEEDLASITAGFIRPFDLSQAPLFRAGVVRVSQEKFLFMLDMHHIISDGVSTNVLFQDITQLYQGKELSPLKVQYKDYAVWQQTDAQVARLQDQEGYWLSQFAGEAPVLEMPTDFPRPAVQQFEGDLWTFEIDADILRQLKKLSASQSSTLYMTLLAAYQVLLAKYTGQDDIIVGSPIAGRAHSDVESIVGMFVNTLALRGHPTGEQTFISYLAQVKEQVLQAYANAEYPFEKLVEKLDLQRDMSRHPLFDTMFTLQNMEISDIDLAGLTFKPFDFEWKNAKFDMDWTMLEEETLKVAIEYSTSLYAEETISRMAQHFTYVLQQIIEHPAIQLAEIKIATLPEIEQILTQFNDTRSNYPDNQTIHSLFEQQVERSPEQIAVVYQNQSITYRELNERANRLARCLIDKGIERNQFVAIMADRSIETVIGMMGILKAGGAYVPIDPDYPLDRKLYILEDSHASLLLLQHKHEVPSEFTGDRILIEQMQWYQAADTNVGIVNTADDLAYMIYTSGSTGQPKGVMIDHQAVCNLCLMAQTYGIFANSRVLQFASYSFDASVGEVFHTLTNGATLYLVDRNLLMAGIEFVEWLRENEITSIPFISPSALRALPYEELPALKYISTGGEALPVDLVKLWGANRIFLNAYGPTETTVDATIGLCTPEDKPHIGKPVLNKKAYIINQDYQLQPIGVPGELCIGGVGIAPGYWNRPELTAEKFVNNPFAQGERMYKTGDLVRWLPDGNIEFLGRIDDQVKVRGHRIELGEIEARLLEHEQVTEAVVLARQDEQGQSYLCAYLVVTDDWTVAELRKHIGKTLPDYMIPAYFIELEEFPLTPSGKVNKKALPEPDGQIQTGVEYVEATTEVQKILVEVWQEVLRVERIGIYDNFFELGGDSIKAIQITARLRRYHRKLEISHLFKHPTIAELAPWIQTSQALIEQGTVEGEVMLTPIQKAFFEENQEQPHHFNQDSLLYSSNGWNQDAIEKVFEKLTEHHDALRMVYPHTEDKVTQINRGLEEKAFTLQVFDFTQEPTDTQTTKIEQIATQLQAGFDLEKGPLVRLGLFTTKAGDYLLIVIHHLVIDGVSWRILLEDFHTAYQQVIQGQAIVLPEKTTSFKTWSERLNEYANSHVLLHEIPYWKQMEEISIAPLPKKGNNDGRYYVKDSEYATMSLTEEETQNLLTRVHRAYRTEINDLLLAALGLASKEWTKENRVAIHLEGHGREEIGEGVDVNRTVGWFTSLFPVVIDLENDELPLIIKSVKETLRRVPNKGMGYGILKHLTSDANKQDITFSIRPEISFNYLGVFDQQEEESESAGIPTGQPISPQYYDTHLLEFNGAVSNNQLHVNCRFAPVAVDRAIVEILMERFKHNLLLITQHCLEKDTVEFTPTDFTEKELSQEQLDDLLDDLFEDIDDL